MGCTLPQDPQERNALVAPQLQHAPPPPDWFDRLRKGAPTEAEPHKIPRLCWDRGEQEAGEDEAGGIGGSGRRLTRQPAAAAAARWWRSGPAPARRHMVSGGAGAGAVRPRQMPTRLGVFAL